MARYVREPEPEREDQEATPEQMLECLGHYLIALWMWRPPHPAVPLGQRLLDHLAADDVHLEERVDRFLAYFDELGLGDHLSDYLDRCLPEPSYLVRLNIPDPPPRPQEAERQAAELLHDWPPPPDVDVWRGRNHFTPRSDPQTRRTQ